MSRYHPAARALPTPTLLKPPETSEAGEKTPHLDSGR